MATYVLSVIGEDRSGLVAALSGVVSSHGGNWENSHMTHLAGKFAGVVLVAVPDVRAAAFLDALVPLREQGLLDIAVEAGEAVEATGPVVHLGLVGQDHPGIVHEVTALLAARHVTIEDIRTWAADAPMDGARLFHVEAALRLPGGVSADTLVVELEALAGDLMVDIEVEPVPEQGSAGALGR